MSLPYNGTEVQGVTYNGAEVQSITYNGVEVWGAQRPIGIVLAQTGGGAGTWQRIDKNGTAVSGVNFNALNPWKGIHDVTIDGQAMVYIPKFYVKTGTFSSGTYSGKKYWIVSENKIDSTYRCHRAFLHSNGERDGFYIGKYIASDSGSGKAASVANADMWVNKSNDASKAACSARGSSWHMMTLYEWAALQFLCLIENGTPDVQTALGYGGSGKTGTTSAKWRGVCDMWNTIWQRVDGYWVDSSQKIYLWPYGKYTSDVYVGYDTSMNGWLTDVRDDSGTNYNLGDVFLAKSVASNKSDGSFGDYIQKSNTTSVLGTVGGQSGDGDASGIFAFNNIPTNWSASGIGFRLAKYAGVNAGGINSNLNDNTPAQIQYAAQNDLAASLWDIGDYFEMTLNGNWQCVDNTITLNNYVIRCVLIGINHNADKEGNHMLHFQMGKNTDNVDVAFYYSKMNTENTNSGGWKSCKMRTITMANLYNTIIPSNWRAVIKPCTKYTDNTGGGSDNASYVTATSDNCFLLAEYEVFGSRTYANSAEQNYQQQYAYYANGNSKARYQHDSPTTKCSYCERSVVTSAVYWFCGIDASGRATSIPADFSARCFSPAFCIG